MHQLRRWMRRKDEAEEKPTSMEDALWVARVEMEQERTEQERRHSREVHALHEQHLQELKSIEARWQETRRKIEKRWETGGEALR